MNCHRESHPPTITHTYLPELGSLTPGAWLTPVLSKVQVLSVEPRTNGETQVRNPWNDPSKSQSAFLVSDYPRLKERHLLK